ncbi:hypothetical protein [Actinoplanes subtropicus]|uniref:hypothetical protein n=1 Tax=Actinoplanes subtropicus TaxID=543632 RepID=UPI0004C45F65|nr:hypothetical protein [Actinoplanes subtropicus]
MSPEPRNATDTDLKSPTEDTKPGTGTGAGAGSRHRSPELTKVSANFQRRAVVAMEVASEVTGDSRTDVLNRAVQFYAYLVKKAEEGMLFFVEDPETGARERVVFF